MKSRAAANRRTQRIWDAFFRTQFARLSAADPFVQEYRAIVGDKADPTPPEPKVAAQ